jgi:hypothetical protein
MHSVGPRSLALPTVLRSAVDRKRLRHASERSVGFGCRIGAPCGDRVLCDEDHTI